MDEELQSLLCVSKSHDTVMQELILISSKWTRPTAQDKSILGRPEEKTDANQALNSATFQESSNQIDKPKGQITPS
ncbi:hypothetical protein RRG08_065129 [Elysia crispata]|uniref:Uncharacterized protein n=1 Tax=Elysia crispata TaxID=231223 RepID=A0AAE1DDH1_9GAST|nr:hypothetical protein RRG08_065129 [Elysia crispata]